jgi:hypothetical protein
VVGIYAAGVCRTVIGTNASNTGAGVVDAFVMGINAAAKNDSVGAESRTGAGVIAGVRGAGVVVIAMGIGGTNGCRTVRITAAGSGAAANTA